MRRMRLEYLPSMDGLNLYGKYSKKPPTGPIEQTPKPEYLIALASCLGVLW